MTEESERLTFPEGFIWGASTSAYQIEGATHEDGRGESVWDTFSRLPGAIAGGDTADVACDHYHRCREDVALMAELGLKAYRFSIAWPRVLPQGTGAVNEAGLDFYDRLVDALLAAGIEPFATLYHWDLPQAQQDAGGWPDRAIVEAFVHYADVVSRRLGDRVHYWATHNEPWVVAFPGHALGDRPPALRSWQAALNAAHHLLLAHGRAVPVLRANGDARTQVGIVLNTLWVDAASDSPEDRAAARRFDGYFNRWFFDPLFKGAYPADMLDFYAPDAPDVQPGDMVAIATPLDFLGINYYNRNVIGAGQEVDRLQVRREDPPGEYTEMGWEVYPPGFYNLLRWVHQEYRPGTIYVTENGAAFPDAIAADGQVHDPRRVAFLRGYLAAAHRAMQEGVPLRGYFVWSLLDNFEWRHGFSKRFGLIYVDYPTQRRIIKDSGRWYASVIRQNGFDAPAGE